MWFDLGSDASLVVGVVTVRVVTLIAFITGLRFWLSGECQTAAPYVMAGQTTELKSSLALVKEAPQVEEVTRLRAPSAAMPFCWVVFVCTCHLSFGSSQTPLL